MANYQALQDKSIGSSESTSTDAIKTEERDAFLSVRQKVMEVVREFEKLVSEGLISKDVADLYKTKLNNNFSANKTGYDDLDAPISADVGQTVIDTIRRFSKAGHSKEAINALVAIGTGKGGAQGVIDFAKLTDGKSPEDILASLKDPQLGWQSTITYLYQLEDETGAKPFKSGLEELFSVEELTAWQQKKADEDTYYRGLHSNYQKPPSNSSEQISADEYRNNPFNSGALGEKAARIISTMPLKPGGWCLENTQNALNKAGFGLGNMGAYALKSLPIFEKSGKFIEVTGSKEELTTMIKDRTLPEGAVVYSTKSGDRRGNNGEAWGDVGIIIADGRIAGYNRGEFDDRGLPKLVYGSTDVLRVFIPRV